MTAARVVPGDDGAGVIDRVGADVPDTWVGQRVWVHSATLAKPFGQPPSPSWWPRRRRSSCSARVSFEAGACLGVPALTAHGCLFADGPVHGLTVLVTDGAGAVGHYAMELGRVLERLEHPPRRTRPHRSSHYDSQVLPERLSILKCPHDLFVILNLLSRGISWAGPCRRSGCSGLGRPPSPSRWDRCGAWPG